MLGLAGCATPQTDALRAGIRSGTAAGIHAAHRIEGVPYFAQEHEQCGPATLAMALGASGIAADPDELRASVYTPGRGGSLAPEMLAAARRRGGLALALDGTLAAVLREVDAGHPVIVLQNLGLWFYPVWHYAVVIGYDLPGDAVILHSGPQRAAPMALELFERTWARSGYWAMVALAPQDLPVTARSADLVEAGAALERVDAHAARTAYEAITHRQPDSFGAWIGLGNSAYALGDAAGAGAAFAQATLLQPGSADAWNNLAGARLKEGALGPARAAIARALALGGEHGAVYAQTAAEIEQAGADRPGAPLAP